jgi:hypothetical protein
MILTTLGLSTVLYEVTDFAAVITGEDFPLSVHSHGSSRDPSFVFSSHSLLISVLTQEEIFCGGNPALYSVWSGIHCVWVNLVWYVGTPPSVVWSPSRLGCCLLLRAKLLESTLYVYEDFLLLDGSFVPSFIVSWLNVFEDKLVHGMG